MLVASNQLEVGRFEPSSLVSQSFLGVPPSKELR